MSKGKVKRVPMEVQCGFCGRGFMQSRWWQVFCSRECKKSAEKTGMKRLKELQDEVVYLRNRIKASEKNELAHFPEGGEE